MQKIYSGIVIGIIIGSTACMERQQQRPKLFPEKLYSDATEIPLTEVNQKKLTMAPVLLEANQGDWQKLNAIANMTYKNDQPIFCMPQYDTSWIKETNTFKEEKKSSLHSNNKPNVSWAEELCGGLYSLARYKGKDIDIDRFGGEFFIVFVNTLLFTYESKEENITEDFMSRFAYNKCNQFFEIPLDYYIPIAFGCLKQYRLMRNKTKEFLPSVDDWDKNKDNFLLLSDSRTISDIKPNESFAKFLRFSLQYPAYTHLTTSLLGLFRGEIGFQVIKDFNACMYSNEKKLVEPVAHGDYTHLINDFYDKANEVLDFEVSEVRANVIWVYDLLQITDKAKVKKEIDQEKDLGYAIFKHEPKTFWDYVFPEDYHIRRKNRASLLCIYIGKYNTTRKNKITPTPLQYSCYRVKKEINPALPDSFDQRLLSKEVYAFEEFHQLIKDIKTLINAKPEEIQQIVDKIYGVGK